MDDSQESYRQYRFAAPPGSTELLLVRHGESAAVRPDEEPPLTDGHHDPDLAPTGRDQAERVADRLAHERIDAIYVTPLRRTAETAAPLARRLGIEPRVERDLREVFLGEWEGGLFRMRVAENGPLAQRMWQEERWDVIPGAESGDDLQRRIRAAVERIVAAHPDGRVVVVCHGGVIGTLLSMASGATPFAFLANDNASISQLVALGDRWLVRCFNDTAHLDPRFSIAAEPVT